MFLVSTQKEWEFKQYIMAYEKVGVTPSVGITMNRSTKKLTYRVWANLEKSQEILLRHILVGLEKPWIYRDEMQRISV